MTVMTASLVLINTARAYDKKYTYIIPEDMVGKVAEGSRVLVPFGGGRTSKEGFILEIRPLEEAVSSQAGRKFEYKPIKQVLDPYALLKKDMLLLLEWMKRRYICTYSDAIKCMLPPGINVKAVKSVKLTDNGIRAFKKPELNGILDNLSSLGGECELEELRGMCGIKSFKSCIRQLCDSGAITVEECYQQKVNAKAVKGVSLARPREEIVEELENNAIKRIQQIRVLEILLDNELVSVGDIQRFAGVTSSVLDTLCRHGYIYYKNIELLRNPIKDRQYERTQHLTPTSEQAAALEKLTRQLDSGIFKESLIHGITGSGKTEVYLQLISHCFSLGKRAILLVPEISLTPQMVERFVSRFGKRVAVMHSRLSLGERFDQWRLISEGKVDVVVGARSAVFAPVAHLGLIIIDEEHEGSYKSESMPRYNTRDVAVRRCQINNGLLVYGSATPSVDTYYRTEKGDLELIQMKHRPNTAKLPEVEMVDMRLELENGNKTPFSARLMEELQKNIHSSQQSILFLNRRGFSTFVICRSCGYTMKCPECNIALTFHSKNERLICHYCGFTVKNPEACPSCQSKSIRHFGVGTQKIEEEIKSRLPESSVLRMDMDTINFKNAHEEILNRFKNENINIMVGTQMIAKGHDFPNVTLVGVLAADGMLNTGDFRANERTFQLLTQVAGRAGRGEKAGRVIVQTYNTEEYSILAACRQDFIGFYRQEITIRERLGYPPFNNIAIVTFRGRKDRQVFETARDIKPSLLEDHMTGFEVLGPSRCPIPKIAGKYRWRVVIKARDLEGLLDRLTEVSDDVWKNIKGEDISMSIDINPYNML